MTEMFDRLRDTLTRLTAQRRTINLFFRDDDVDEDEATLHRLLEIFGHREIPVNLAIIPARLTASASALLREALRRRPELLELNQHGWQHVNHETAGRKCEFGPSRNYADQLSDITHGKKVLEDAFGDAFTPVFVPPWNRCTTETFRVLDELGFQALSRLRQKETVTDDNFRELSVTLDLYRWKGGATRKEPREFIDELISQLSEFETPGVMLHHKVMDEAACSFLASLLDELRRHTCVRFHTFQSLLKAD